MYEPGTQERCLAKSLNLGIFGTKMVFIAMKGEEITIRLSIEREEDKGPLS